LLPSVIDLLLDGVIDIGADLAGSDAFNPLIVILRLTGDLVALEDTGSDNLIITGSGNLTGTGPLATSGALTTTDTFLGAGLGAAFLGARIDASFDEVKNISMIIE
jgi:hypothetical protein